MNFLLIPGSKTKAVKNQTQDLGSGISDKWNYPIGYFFSHDFIKPLKNVSRETILFMMEFLSSVLFAIARK